MSYGPIARGTTSKTIGVRILDTTSVVGAGKTGLTYNTANLTCYYKRQLDTAVTQIVLATTTVGVWVSSGFVEIDSTHMAGQYELGLPNAAIGTSDASTWVEIYFYDAGSALGIPQTVAHIPLWAADPQASAFAANLTQILGTTLTETVGQLAAGFKKWFNVAVPTSTMNEVTLVDTTTNLTNAPSFTDPLTNVPSHYSAGQIGAYLDADLSAIKAKTDTIGSASLTFNAPSINGGTEPLVTNRSYKNAYGNAITFTVANLSVDLTAPGITTSFRILVGTSQPFPGVATSATGGYIEIAAASTASWAAGSVETPDVYDTEFVVLDNGDPIHIVSGTIPVIHGVG